MERRDDQPPIKEAVGVFLDATELQAALDELVSAGFAHEQIGLLAGEHTVRQALGHLYEQANEFAGDAAAPRTAFVRKQSLGEVVHAWLGTLAFVGTTTAAGAVVVSAAVLGGAVASAATGALTIGAVGAVLAMIIGKSDAEYLEEQVDEGRMLLFVRTVDAKHEKLATRILRKHSQFDVKVCAAPREP